jgi:predicted nucleotidyltransferase
MSSIDSKIDSNDIEIRSNSDDQPDPSEKNEREIDWLFGSGTRVDVLWAFLQNPDEWLGSRDLEKLTGKSQSDCRRNMIILYSIGLIEPRMVRSETELPSARRRPYRLRNRHPWIPTLRMLLETSIGSLSILSEAIKKLPDIDIAFIYGSFATSEQRPDSDIDLMVIGKHSLMTLAEPMSVVEKRIGREINYIANSPEDWQNKFKERNHFVASLMAAPKIFIVGDADKLEKITIPFLNET